MNFNTRRRFDRMFPEIALQESARAKGDDELYKRLVERGSANAADALSANKPVEESTLEELDNKIGYFDYGDDFSKEEFYRLERDEQGNVKVYEGGRVKFVEEGSKQEIFKTFLADS